MRTTISKMTALYRLLCLVCVLATLTACSDPPTLSKLNDDAVILAFGDSLTRGNGAGEAESYPAILEKLTGRRVVNAGVSGELSARGLSRLPALLDQHKPDLLILCHGGNDILRKRGLDQMGTNLNEMIRLAKERDIPVIMLGVPQPGIFLSSADIYREIAESTGIIFLEDLIPDVLSDKSLKSDTVHPNRNGYRKIAEEIFAVLMDTGAI